MTDNRTPKKPECFGKYTKLMNAQVEKCGHECPHKVECWETSTKCPCGGALLRDFVNVRDHTLHRCDTCGMDWSDDRLAALAAEKGQPKGSR